MKLNKILPIIAIAGTVAVVAPMITSCSCASSVKNVWERTTLGQQYEGGYTQKCIDSTQKIKIGEIADKFFGFQKNVRQSVNDDVMRTIANNDTSLIGMFAAETSKFDKDTLRLTSKCTITQKAENNDKVLYSVNYDNVPMEFLYDFSENQIMLTPLGMQSGGTSTAIWSLPNWSIEIKSGFGNYTFSPNSSTQEVASFYDDATSYCVTILSYFEGIQIE